MEAVDVVIPMRRAPLAEWPRYALRSLANLPHRRVWLVGYLPGWARGVGHIEAPASGNKWANLLAAMRAACGEPEVADRFVYMNDDMFFLEPMAEAPVLHGGPIREFMGRAVQCTYRKGMRAADVLLRRMGVEEPLSYELHTPLPVCKTGMLEALGRAQAAGGCPPGQVRSLYGNLAGIGGDLAGDVKTYGASSHLWPGPLASTAPGAWARSAVAGKTIRSLFPDPGPYEE